MFDKSTIVVTFSAVGLLLAEPTYAANCGSSYSYDVTQALVERMVFNSHSIFVEYPQGGKPLIALISIVVTANTRTGTIAALKLAKTGTSLQKTAIAAGMRIAAYKCRSSHQQETAYIEQSIRKSSDQDLIRAYAGASNIDEPHSSSGASATFNTGLGTPSSTSGTVFGSGLSADKTSGSPQRRELLTDPFAAQRASPLKDSLAPIGAIR